MGPIFNLLTASQLCDAKQRGGEGKGTLCVGGSWGNLCTLDSWRWQLGKGNLTPQWYWAEVKEMQKPKSFKCSWVYPGLFWALLRRPISCCLGGNQPGWPLHAGPRDSVQSSLFLTSKVAGVWCHLTPGASCHFPSSGARSRSMRWVCKQSHV